MVRKISSYHTKNFNIISSTVLIDRLLHSDIKSKAFVMALSAVRVLGLMFFWPCIMNWLYINYQLWCTDYYLFIKYYSPLHVSSLKCSSSGGYSCTHAAYGTVTLYESSWWPVGTQLEWELTVGGRLLVGVSTSHQDLS